MRAASHWQHAAVADDRASPCIVSTREVELRRVKLHVVTPNHGLIHEVPVLSSGVHFSKNIVTVAPCGQGPFSRLAVALWATLPKPLPHQHQEYRLSC